MGQPHRERGRHHYSGLLPYDQVSAQDYPPMLVTAGLNDPGHLLGTGKVGRQTAPRKD